MRSYLYVFWALVITGIILLTAAHPEYCRVSAASHAYYVCDSSGRRMQACGNVADRVTEAAAFGRRISF